MAVTPRLYLTEERWPKPEDGQSYQVDKIQDSVEWTIGQTLTRKELAELIRIGRAKVTISKRKDQ